MQTALIAFPNTPILIHYELREVGSTVVPENIPRDITLVLDELRNSYSLDRVDATTLLPPLWPRRHDMSPRVVRRDRVRCVWRDFVPSRPETVVAIVAHCNVIQAALTCDHHPGGPIVTAAGGSTNSIQPRNAIPIPCCLDHSGLRILVEPTLPSTSGTPAVDRVGTDMQSTDNHLLVALENTEDETAATLLKPLALESTFHSSAT